MNAWIEHKIVRMHTGSPLNERDYAESKKCIETVRSVAESFEKYGWPPRRNMGQLCPDWPEEWQLIAELNRQLYDFQYADKAGRESMLAALGREKWPSVEELAK
jgi:hypothetical protein